MQEQIAVTVNFNIEQLLVFAVLFVEPCVNLLTRRSFIVADTSIVWAHHLQEGGGFWWRHQCVHQGIRHEELTQHWVDVDPPSATLAQSQPNIGLISRVHRVERDEQTDLPSPRQQQHPRQDGNNVRVNAVNRRRDFKKMSREIDSGLRHIRARSSSTARSRSSKVGWGEGS